MAGLKIIGFASKIRINPGVIASCAGLQSNTFTARSYSSKDEETHTGQVRLF
jgi:hypothetical protein